MIQIFMKKKRTIIQNKNKLECSIILNMCRSIQVSLQHLFQKIKIIF